MRRLYLVEAADLERPCDQGSHRAPDPRNRRAICSFEDISKPKDPRQQLIEFLDRKVFEPILHASADQYSRPADRLRLQHVQRNTESRSGDSTTIIERPSRCMITTSAI
jgi:hypothetical protein